MAAAHHHVAYSVPSGEQMRLPSLRQMDFYQPGKESSHPGFPQSAQPEQSPVPSQYTRHDAASPWGARSSSSASVPASQHATAVHPAPSEVQKSHYAHPSDRQFITPDVPASASVGHGARGATGNNGNRVENPQNATKRTRSSSSLSETPGRSPHSAYPQNQHTLYTQQPPPSYHQSPAPPASEPSHHPAAFAHPGYAQYAHQQNMPPRQYTAQQAHQYATQVQNHPAPPPRSASSQQASPLQQHRAPPSQAPPVTHQVPPQHSPVMSQAPPPSASYPPPPSHQPAHWQPAPQPVPSAPPPQVVQTHHGYENYARAPAPAAPVDTRVPSAIDASKLATRQDTISKIVEHCHALYQFANRYELL
ncbi:hypothetical protein K474DRAFT_1162998 [Panus rudis PR-1116 ss-1]|nr:hypothetical protein K474DRAFT_1162998 [Panus rudis PR-1116 ss-1]